MWRKTVSVVIGSFVLLNVTLSGSAQDKAPSPDKAQDRQPIRYEAEEGLPKDKAGETRRDYAVLEAALNDLASPQNPENKTYIENHSGPLREIIIDRNTLSEPSHVLGGESRNSDYKDPRNIPADLRKDFKRRNHGPSRSLADFKPANRNILVRNLDKEFKDSADFVGDFLKKYPTAWGYVWAYPPAYSKDGESAIVLFEGGPNGIHGLSWVYMLNKKGKRWEVKWRHLHLRE
jgi:hypothetical protein